MVTKTSTYNDIIAEQWINFDILDPLIIKCLNKKNLILENIHIPFISDLSAENYKDLKAIRTSDSIAKSVIDSILDYEIKSNSNIIKIFQDYTKKIIFDLKFGIEIRNVKAYWLFEKYKPDNNLITDYEGSCGFIEKFHKKALEVLENLNNPGIMYSPNDLSYIKELIKDNLPIVNGLELLEACLIRKLINQKLSLTLT